VRPVWLFPFAVLGVRRNGAHTGQKDFLLLDIRLER
jgi:hypothetical protein